MNENRGHLHGGALTAEVIDSSRTVYSGGRQGTGTGLQQYFTPPEVGGLLTRLFNPSLPTLDPTAGDGALLDWVDLQARYGIEIDRDQIAWGNYRDQAITGDIQKIYPLLRGLGARWPQVVANPPFGLEWSVPGIEGSGSSTLRMFQMMCRLTGDYGQAAFICGRDRYMREISRLPETRRVWALIETGNLFQGVELPIVVALLVGGSCPVQSGTPTVLEASRGTLPDLASRLIELRERNTGFRSATANWGAAGIGRLFVEARSEHAKRDDGRETGRHDLVLNGQKLRVRLSEYAKVALVQAGGGMFRKVLDLNGLAVSWVALNPKQWRQILELAERGCVTIEPALLGLVAQASELARREMVPLYRVEPQQRLGYLTDIENIVCRKDLPDRDFRAGESYPISTHSRIRTEIERRPYEKKDGSCEMRRFEQRRRILEIRIGGHSFTEETADVELLLEHFEIPDPGDIADRLPDQVQRAREILDRLTVRHGWAEEGLAWKTLTDPETGRRIPWQKEDLARLIVKGRGMLAWEQGGGKSLGLLSLALGAIEYHHLQRACLMVIPQDLLPQWRREAKRFFGIEFEVIDTPIKARQVARHLKQGGEGSYVTWFEALSINGTINETLPDGIYRHKRTLTDRYGNRETRTVELSSEEACPSCAVPQGDRWSDRACRACGYVHKTRKVHSAARWLSTAFKDGVICVDEISEIRGPNSKRGKAVRSLRAKCRFGGSGTPIANYVSDSFNALWWTTGGGSLRFPYGYQDRSAFEDTFAVTEAMFGSRERGEGNQVKRRKVLPQVSNVAQLWRLLAAQMVRRRQEHMGDLVARSDIKVEVPMGTTQRKLHRGWLDGFADWFSAANPDHPLVAAGMVERFAPMIGQLAKLEAAATFPPSDPDTGWAEERFTAGRKVSPWTPAVLKALELAMEHARNGEKVLVGSGRIDTGQFLADRLKERGVKATHIVEAKRDGRYGTKNPRKRAKEIRQFADGDCQVLCVGIQAMRLGHDLAAASVAIVLGLPWSHTDFVQFQRRVHRLTSKRPVTVYSIIPKGSLADRKYQLLTEKSAAADLALDGRLVDEPDEPVDWGRQLEGLRRMGVSITENDTIEETGIEALWTAAEGPYRHLLSPAPVPIAVVPGPPDRGGGGRGADGDFTPFAFELSDEDTGEENSIQLSFGL